MINLGDRIDDIVAALERADKLGTRTPGRVKKGDIRFGNHGSLRITVAGAKRGDWHDHESKEGGSDPFSLIATKGGYDKQQTADWIRETLGLVWSRAQKGYVETSSIEPPGDLGPILATYDYTDEHGAPLFQVARFADHQFRQRRPNGKGGWIWKRGDARLVLYHLRDLIAAKATGNGHPWRVYIPEGEKDVDRLRRDWGVTATCNPAGAGKWRDEYNQYFAGADVIILQDNDDVGRRHARQVAESVAKVAMTARIVELGGLSEKGDISDWLDLGGSQSDLETLIEGTEPWTKPDHPPTPDAGVGLTDFYAYMIQANFIYTPTRDPWPAKSVNARIPPIQLGVNDKGDPIFISASAWLAQNRPVEQITWAPGLPPLIKDRLISEGGWIPRDGVNVLNLYRGPLLTPGDPSQAQPWLDHVKRVYPLDADHIVRWFAQRTQHPEIKINHAIMLGGLQGIGKDTIIEPVKRAVGPWNVAEPSPKQLSGAFNGFAKSVILRISEAHDLGDIDRYQFYEHLKVYCSAPPDVIRINEKNLREYTSLNCCGVIITTNHKTDGIYLPADDRRHYVTWSELTKADFTPSYWNDLWSYYDNGGDRHVLAYLQQLDLSGFDPKAPPPKTEAFWEIVNAGSAPEDSELADVLDLLGKPPIVALAQLIKTAEGSHTSDGGIASEDFVNWLKDRKNRRNIPHRLEACGYTPLRNPDRDTGLWVVSRRRMALYGRTDLPLPERLAAAQALTGQHVNW